MADKEGKAVVIGSYDGSLELRNRPASENTGLTAFDNTWAIVMEENGVPLYAMVAASAAEEIRMAVIRMLREKNPNIAIDATNQLDGIALQIGYRQYLNRTNKVN